MINQELIHTILQEVNTLLRKGVMPVSVDHIKHLCQEDDALECLITMKNEGLISGDLVTIVASGAPHRMTNIRLTYAGMRAMRR